MPFFCLNVVCFQDFFSFFKQEAMISKQKMDPELEDKTQEAIGEKKPTCLKKIVPFHATGLNNTLINFFPYRSLF